MLITLCVNQYEIYPLKQAMVIRYVILKEIEESD